MISTDKDVTFHKIFYACLKLGGLFSAKAFIPSFWSS